MNEPADPIWPAQVLAAGVQQSFLSEEDLERVREQSFTKDITSVHDVPLAAVNSKVIRSIPVRVRGPDGKLVAQEVFGRTVHRRAPHPQSGSQDGSGVVMTALTTTILYHGGVISDLHQDILYAVIHLWEQRYHATHDTSPTLGVTKPEIARIIGQQINGGLRKKIDEAVSTLRGVEVIKFYHAASGLNEVIEVIGGFFQNYSIERAAAGGHRPADMMMLTLNSALVNALTGRSASREWALRPLNMTRMLRYTQGWKRSFYRQLDARLYKRGILSVPLRELWIDILGQDPEVANTPANWRDIRRRIKAFLVELESTGYIASFEFFTRRASDARVSEEIRDLAAETTPGFMEVKVARSLSGVTYIEVPVRDQAPLREWLECRPGPTFLEGQPKARVDFARDIALSVCERPEQAEALLARFGAETIVEMGYGHLRVLVREIADRLDRLPVRFWLRGGTPVPTLAHLERVYTIEYSTRARARAVGDQVVQVPQFEAQRLAAIIPHFEARVRTYCNEHPLRSQFALPEEPLPTSLAQQVGIYASEGRASCENHPVMGVMLEAFTLVVDRFVGDRLISRDVLVPHLRAGSVEYERIWNNLAIEALPLAIRIAGMCRWSEELARRIDPLLAEVKPITLSPYYIAAAKRFPASAQLVANLTASGATPWENEFGYRFARRLAERYLEERNLATRESTAAASESFESAAPE